MTEETKALMIVGSGALAAPSPAVFVDTASRMAQALASVVERQKLYAMIQGKKYVTVEGWTTLSSMLGVIPLEISNDAQEDGTYIAVVELRKPDGSVLGRASSECGGPEDKVWGQREAYARRSMAATRATSKACRLSFSWIMTLAGYAATPAEEMDFARREEAEEKPGIWTGDATLTFGKSWKGKKWSQLKETELTWIIQNMDPKKGAAVKYAKFEIERRAAIEGVNQAPPQEVTEAEVIQEEMFK